MSNYHKFGGIKHQKCVLSQSRRIEIQNQTVRSSLKALEKIPAFSLPASGGSGHSFVSVYLIPISVSVFSWHSFCVCVFSSSISYKTVVIGFRAYLNNSRRPHLKSLNLIKSMEIFFQNHVAFTSSRFIIYMHLLRSHHSIHNIQFFSWENT